MGHQQQQTQQKANKYTYALNSYKEALRIAKLNYGSNSSSVAHVLYHIAYVKNLISMYSKDSIDLYVGCATIHQENYDYRNALFAYIAALKVIVDDDDNNKSSSLLLLQASCSSNIVSNSSVVASNTNIATTNDRLNVVEKLES